MSHGQLAFRVVPLAVLVTAAAAALLFGNAWSAQMAAVPWLVALVVVGLPHGAADFAVSRRLCGWPATVRVFAAYGAVMAVVMLALVLAPRPMLLFFAAISIWHFGLSHAHGQSLPVPEGWQWLTLAAVARGASVLGVPLAVWPGETAAVVTDLVRFVGGSTAGSLIAFAPGTVRATGAYLTAAGLTALAWEAIATRRHPGTPGRSGEAFVDLLLIGLLGVAADPLFSIGLYFLCWHAWREMRPLMAVIAPPAARGSVGADDLATLARGMAAVHVAAIPLLIPTWAALGIGWWLLSPSHSPRDLAILSLVVYVVVTPSHEAFVECLASGRLWFLWPTAPSSASIVMSPSVAIRRTGPFQEV